MKCLCDVADLFLGDNMILRVHYYNGKNECINTESFNKWLNRQAFVDATNNHWHSKILWIGTDYTIACEVIDGTVLENCPYGMFMVIHLDCTLCE